MLKNEVQANGYSNISTLRLLRNTMTDLKASAFSYPPRLSFTEKAQVYGKLATVATSALIKTAVRAPFRGNNGAKSLRMHFSHAMIRKMNDSLTTRQYQCVDTLFLLLFFHNLCVLHS
jgi:hypothetical protein